MITLSMDDLRNRAEAEKELLARGLKGKQNPWDGATAEYEKAKAASNVAAPSPESPLRGLTDAVREYTGLLEAREQAASRSVELAQEVREFGGSGSDLVNRLNDLRSTVEYRKWEQYKLAHPDENHIPPTFTQEHLTTMEKWGELLARVNNNINEQKHAARRIAELEGEFPMLKDIRDKREFPASAATHASLKSQLRDLERSAGEIDAEINSLGGDALLSHRAMRVKSWLVNPDALLWAQCKRFDGGRLAGEKHGPINPLGMSDYEWEAVIRYDKELVPKRTDLRNKIQSCRNEMAAFEIRYPELRQTQVE